MLAAVLAARPLERLPQPAARSRAHVERAAGDLGGREGGHCEEGSADSHRHLHDHVPGGEAIFPSFILSHSGSLASSSLSGCIRETLAVMHIVYREVRRVSIYFVL